MIEIYDPSKPVKMFKAFVPEQFLRDTVSCVFESYQIADEHCAQYSKADRHYLQPHYRNTVLASRWRSLATSMGIDARSRPNRNRSAYHTRIKCDRVVLTVSFVNDPCKIVRSAKFRKTYAEEVTLFSTPKGSSGGKLYAILLHGGQQLVKPDFIDIVFPDRACEQYIDKIKLLPLYAQNGQPVAAEEIVRDTLDVQIRPIDQRKSGA